MPINLSKGERFDLSKATPNLKKIAVGLGWDVNRSDTGAGYDLDASVFMLGSNGKIPGEAYFVFYNNLTSPDGAVIHTGDNLTGQGEGDDETILVNLSEVNKIIQELVFVVTIHEAKERKQNFGQVSDAFIRIYDQDTGRELVRYDLSEDFSTETAIEFGRLYKKEGGWKIQAVGQGYNAGLQGFVNRFYEE